MSRIPIWRAPRVDYCAQGRIWVMREQAECFTVNISESGLLVVTPLCCEPGMNVRIDLPFPGYSRPMPIPAVVVRETEVDGEYAVGVRFESMLAGSLEVLRGFIQKELASMRSSDQLDPLGPEAGQSGIEATHPPELRPEELGAVALPPELRPEELGAVARPPELRPEELGAVARPPELRPEELGAVALQGQAGTPFDLGEDDAPAAPARPATRPIDLGELDEAASQPGTPLIDLAELDAAVALPDTDQFPRSIDAPTSEVPLSELEDLDELGQRRPKTEVRRVKRRALERLRRKAATVNEPAPAEDQPAPFRRRPGGIGRAPDHSALDRPRTQELTDVPEWVDGPRQIYDDEEQELINESEQDERLKHLYRAAVVEVSEAEKERAGKKKKKGWF